MCNNRNSILGSSKSVGSKTALRKHLLSSISNLSSKVSEVDSSVLVYSTKEGTAIETFGKIQDTTDDIMTALESNLRQLVSNANTSSGMLHYIYLNLCLSRLDALTDGISKELIQKLKMNK